MHKEGIPQTKQKGDRNFVTVYDTKVQEFIQKELKKLYPEVYFIGEEADVNTNNPYECKCFICDPIDGTANFRRSYKHSGISLAYIEYGQVIMGVVLQPYTNDLFYAEKGKGSFLNGEQIFVSNAGLNESMLSFGTSPYYPELSKKTIDLISKLMPIVEDIRRTGAAAPDLSYIANGRNDVFFELMLSPWDFAAASLIIEEAGGIITDDKGNKPSLDKPTPIIAGNKKAYKELFEKYFSTI